MDQGKIDTSRCGLWKNATPHVEAASLHDAQTREAERAILGMLPISESVARLIVKDADHAISALVRSRKVARRTCSLTGATVVVDRRPSERATFTTGASGRKVPS